MNSSIRVYGAFEAMHHDVSYRFTLCQQYLDRSANSPRELPRSKEQRRSSVLLWICSLMSSCLPNFEMQSEYRSRSVERAV